MGIFTVLCPVFVCETNDSGVLGSQVKLFLSSLKVNSFCRNLHLLGLEWSWNLCWWSRKGAQEGKCINLHLEPSLLGRRWGSRSARAGRESTKFQGKSGRKEEECPRNEALLTLNTFIRSKPLESCNLNKGIRAKINNIQQFRCQKEQRSYWCERLLPEGETQRVLGN